MRVKEEKDRRERGMRVKEEREEREREDSGQFIFRTTEFTKELTTCPDQIRLLK